MSKHTPGPWVAVKYSEERRKYWIGFIDRPGTNGSPSAVVETAGSSDEEELSNIALIAAAPELLEALKKLHAYVDCQLMSSFDKESKVEIMQDIGRIAMPAITKAEGK